MYKNVFFSDLGILRELTIQNLLKRGNAKEAALWVDLKKGGLFQWMAIWKKEKKKGLVWGKQWESYMTGMNGWSCEGE